MTAAWAAPRFTAFRKNPSIRRQDRLGDLLQLKYHTINDAAEQLGGVPEIRDTFIGFQQYLYERAGEAANVN
jgi:hypothetical protein